MFSGRLLTPDQARAIPLRVLAHLGDAVFDLFEREREALSVSSAKKMHQNIVRRVQATAQADHLDAISPKLNDSELELVRQARNLKARGARSASQGAYRKSTAFEALIAYLYLTAPDRLEEILRLTKTEGNPPGDNRAPSGDP